MNRCMRVGAVALLCAAWVGAAAGQDLRRRDLMPEDAPLALEISGAQDVIKALGRSSLGRIWQDAQVRRMFGKADPSELLRDLIFADAKEKDAKLLTELFGLFQGEILAAFRLQDGDDPDFYLAVAMREADYARLREIFKSLDSDGKDIVRRHRFQDVDLYQRYSAGEDEEAQESAASWEAFAADTLVVGPSRDWVEKCVARLRRGRPAEPQEPAPGVCLRMNFPLFFQELYRREEKEQKALAANMDPEMAQIMQATPKMRDVFDAMGFSALGKTALHVRLHADRTECLLTMPIADWSQGLWTIFDTQPTSLDLQSPLVPLHACSYDAGRIDLPRFLRHLPQAIKRAAPASAAQVDAALAQVDALLGISLHNDLLAHLDTQYVSFSSRVEGQAADLMALRLKNEGQVKNALAKMLGEGATLRMMLGASAGLRVDEIAGEQMYSFGAAAPEASAPLVKPQRQALAAAAGNLLFGAEGAVREALLAGQRAPAAGGDSFYATPFARRLRSLTPPNAFQYNAVNWPELSKAVLDEEIHRKFQEMARETLQEGRAEQADGPAGRALAQLDLSRWPTIAHLASFLGPSFSYAMKTDQGMQIRLLLYYEPLR